MRICPAAIFWFLAATPALHGEVFTIFLLDPRPAGVDRRYLGERDGQAVLIGESLEGIEYDPAEQTIYFAERNQLLPGRPDDPSFVPYQLKDGERVYREKQVVELPGHLIDRVVVSSPRHTLASLAAEHRHREQRREGHRKAGRKLRRRTPEWAAHRAYLATLLERDWRWLDSTVYPEAAQDLARELGKVRDQLQKQDVARRRAAALDSITAPRSEPELTQAVTGGQPAFASQESLHLRVVYTTDIPHARIRALLELAEEALEGFRREAVDPHLDETFADHIPDQVVLELCFGPDDLESFARIFEHYGIDLGPQRERSLRSKGIGRDRRHGPPLNCWRAGVGADLEGRALFNLGHVLADLHFNQGRNATRPPLWLAEAVACHLSDAYLGRIRVGTVSFTQRRYARQPGASGSLALGSTDRQLYHRVALDEGPSLTALCLREPHEFEAAENCKARSLFEFVLESEGERGQRWLRALGDAFCQESQPLEHWRAPSEQLFQLTGTDVFAALEQRWREYAKAQLTDD